MYSMKVSWSFSRRYHLSGNCAVVTQMLLSRRKKSSRHRKQKTGLSQQRFCAAFGISPGTLRHLEQGLSVIGVAC